MDGFSTTDSSASSHSDRTQITDRAGASLRMPRCPVESGPDDTPSAGLHTAVDSAVCNLYEDDPPAFADNEEDCRLIRSLT
jgi:hypothetical protein